MSLILALEGVLADIEGGGKFSITISDKDGLNGNVVNEDTTSEIKKILHQAVLKRIDELNNDFKNL